jgi:adenylate cyclase class 2
MHTNYQEIEVKFFINSPSAVENRLQQLGAQVVQPRVKEINYRFDTQGKKLSSDSKVLRLRQDSKQWITYKGPGTFVDGVKVRKEIEFEVSDIHAARDMLEALGYHVYQIYEKVRTVFGLGNTKIMLDELPYGNFLEIEGPDTTSVISCADRLGLEWVLKIDISYMEIYKRLCDSMGIIFGDLLFDQISGTEFLLDKINIHPADH